MTTMPATTVAGILVLEFSRGDSYGQAPLFPEPLDERLPADHVSWVFDAFVGSLDRGAPG